MVIKASFKGCAVADRRLFKKGRCIVPISVGAKVHEGGKLLAMLQLISRSFKDCTILIDDTIQRHTLRLLYGGVEEKLLYETALKSGDDWLERNQQYFPDVLHIPYKVLRWDYWLSHKKYSEHYEKICFLFDENVDYRESFYLTAKEFLKRQSFKVKESIYYEQKKIQSCIDYLKEECAVMCLWGLDEGYEFEVYPSGRNRAMIATYEVFIRPRRPNLLKIVGIRFKKS